MKRLLFLLLPLNIIASGPKKTEKIEQEKPHKAPKIKKIKYVVPYNTPFSSPTQQALKVQWKALFPEIPIIVLSSTQN